MRTRSTYECKDKTVIVAKLCTTSKNEIPPNYSRTRLYRHERGSIFCVVVITGAYMVAVNSEELIDTKEYPTI